MKTPRSWLKASLVMTALSVFTATPASADGLPVTPGLWKSTSTILVSVDPTSPDGAAPEITTSETCISRGSQVLGAEQLAGPGCSPSDITQNEDGISFVLVCKTPEATLYGTMTAMALSGGTQTEAHMTLTGRRADGREVAITADFSGERLGPCTG